MSEHNHPLTPPCPACEAAAIARDREGLVERVARNLWRADEAMVTGDYAAHEAEARRLLAIPEAQEADPIQPCGHRLDDPGHTPDACLFPEAQETDRG
jgi:hypothetical protein